MDDYYILLFYIYSNISICNKCLLHHIMFVTTYSFLSLFSTRILFQFVPYIIFQVKQTTSTRDFFNVFKAKAFKY